MGGILLITEIGGARHRQDRGPRKKHEKQRLSHCCEQILLRNSMKPFQDGGFG